MNLDHQAKDLADHLSILKRYWGYDTFRPLQEDIVNAVLRGEDVLALLPTGGGKSVCFQVPAMAMDGICLVITPLIALMKDQVEQLNKRGIKSVGIYAGMRRKEIDIKLDNCIYGDIKFLYLSPERLKTDLFRERIQKMKVSLLAVDEAHCISQWGYDFRPAYLDIAEIRPLIPGVNLIALTATATPLVRDDIQDKLQFASHNVFQKSFARHNLSYSVRKVEDKLAKVVEVLRHVKGTAVVYTRTRKDTKQIAAWLIKNGFSADFYHAGLSHEQRVHKQDSWINDQKRIMVATNAFGMGIDKPDVRVVVHMDIPQNLESYYQEAGRAGRDEQKAYAVIIYGQDDIEKLKTQIGQQHPSIDTIKRVYQCLANYYKMAVGSGLGQSFDFDIQDFSDHYQLHHMDVYYTLKKLEEEGLLTFTEGFYSPSQIYFTVDNRALYEYQIANARMDQFIKGILRMYGGELFSSYMRISETQMAKFMGVQEHEVVQLLERLDDQNIINYDKKKDKPQVIFTMPRQDVNAMSLDRQRLAERKRNAEEKMNAMINYVASSDTCRTLLILEYFGEYTKENCGVCDVCLQERRSEVQGSPEEVISKLEAGPMRLPDLVNLFHPSRREYFIDLVRRMIDGGLLKYNENNELIPN